jgi:hypothetical protein
MYDMSGLVGDTGNGAKLKLCRAFSKIQEFLALIYKHLKTCDVVTENCLFRASF